MSNLLQTAINAALSQDWQKAISANKNLLKENKEDINSLNRLAHAYAKIGNLDDARKLYRKILSIDKYNVIALKNLDKLNSLPKSAKATQVSQPVSYSLSPSLFIEEPGKTKTLLLVNTAPASIISHLNPGDPVKFYSKKHSIDIRTLTNVYLGALPDDFAFRLLRFIKAGYEYAGFIRSASKNSVSVFIRETKRAKKFSSQPSFLASTPAQIRNMFADHKKPENDDDTEDSPAQDNLEDE